MRRVLAVAVAGMMLATCSTSVTSDHFSADLGTLNGGLQQVRTDLSTSAITMVSTLQGDCQVLRSEVKTVQRDPIPKSINEATGILTKAIDDLVIGTTDCLDSLAGSNPEMMTTAATLLAQASSLLTTIGNELNG